MRVAHAALSRRRKGTAEIVAACDELGVELDVIEDVRHDEVGPRLAQADLVVDQLNSGWYGLFAIEAMAHGKPVAGFVHEEAARRTADAFGIELPIGAPRAGRTAGASTTRTRWPTACWTSTLGCRPCSRSRSSA